MNAACFFQCAGGSERAPNEEEGWVRRSNALEGRHERAEALREHREAWKAGFVHVPGAEEHFEATNSLRYGICSESSKVLGYGRLEPLKESATGRS